LVNKVLEDEVGRPNWRREPTGAHLMRQALGNGHGADSDLSFALTLNRPLVAIGAPVAAYLPQVAASLHTELVIPPHAAVANAVGAVSGSIVQRLPVIINPLGGDGSVRLHLPDGVCDFDGIEPAVTHAEAVLTPYLIDRARAAGAEHVEVRMVRFDRWAPVATGLDQKVFLGSELSFTAAGRPSPARAA
jgi:N-methylhydantoinase A/oxoprolinase/acetone carboxylase beta subunit